MGSPQQPGTSSQTWFKADDWAKIQDAYKNLSSGVSAFDSLSKQNAGKVATNFSQFAPQLQTEFKGPQFGNQLDAFGQNLVSRGMENLTNQANAMQRQYQSKFGNNGTSRVLSSLASMRSRLQGNELPFMAGAEMRQRQGQEYQLGQQAQSLTNQARLSQATQGANMQNMGNAALGQQLDMRQSGLNNLLNILGSAAGLGAMRGRQETVPLAEENKYYNTTGPMWTWRK